MASAYKQLLGSGGVTGFVLAGAVGRIALPMTGIGIITMLSQEHGSYTLAGGVAATFVLTYALLSPQLSRLVDRHGQAAVLRIASSICAVGFMILIAASHWQAPVWTLYTGAFLAGFMPSISAMVRARWTALHRGDPLLQTAYSLETVLDEVTFIAGPPLAVGLSMLLFPQAALAVALILLLLGVAGLVLQPGTEPALPAGGATHPPSVIRLPAVRLLTLLLVTMSIGAQN